MTGVWIALTIVVLLLAAFAIDRRSRARRTPSGQADGVSQRDRTDAVARNEQLRTGHAIDHDGRQWGTYP